MSLHHSNYVHLHIHTQYSLLDGACRIKELIQKAIDYQMPAVAMTDHGNIFGAIDFYQTASQMGIKPIIGCECYIAPASRHDKNPRQAGLSHLVLFAKDLEGYRNLIKLISASYLEGFYYRPRMDMEILEKYSKGLIATSACLRGKIPQLLQENKFDEACQWADHFQHIFGKGNFYLELMDHGIPEQKIVNEALVKISQKLKIPPVVTNDVHYLEQPQYSAHEALMCIQTQSFLSDENRMRLRTDQFYFKSPEEMRETFRWIPEAVDNTVELADKCNLKLNFDQIHLPHYDPPKGKTKEKFLEELCLQGVKRRYGRLTQEIKDRLKHELATISKMRFVEYFLIVWDFIRYAKEHDIPVGPGRGSAAGSIVSYLLGITSLDPLKYNLLFERFLNPDRAGMPDIDIDFCFERRPEVIDYVTHKYGKDNVAQIITFGKMNARAAIRDVGRVMSVPYGDVDKIAKLVPSEIGITIDRALNIEPQFKKMYKEDKVAAEIIDTAQVLEGLNRHASIHAAGVVIGDKPLTEYVPLFRTSDGQITTGYSMDGIAAIGLLKMDFLGLRTLTVIDKAIKWVKRVHNTEIDMSSLPINDARTYELLSEANSFGIFQLESSGMRELLKKTKPTQFEDLIAILALYRPGPMGSGMLDDFIKRKKGHNKVEYPHPKLTRVLKETFGIIVYQEQVMQMASVLAGFTMAQADNLRRAMSKKKVAVMDKMRIQFVRGCKKTSNIHEREANSLFDLIDYFSGYGFNKSHSAAYALISYQTAYLKANYPVEFMCALLTCEKDNTEKVVEYVKDSEANGMTVLPPDVNESLEEFSVIDEKTIRFGLLAVKNVGQTAIESIVQNRLSDGPFVNLYDFCERVDLRLANRKVLESLIKCGAFDCFGARRSQLVAILDKALEIGSRAQKERASGQMSFFNMEEDRGGFNDEIKDLPDMKEWPQNQILAYEKEFLGFYISGHPLLHYKTEIKEFTDYNTKTLSNATEGQEVKIIGIINAIKLTTTRKSNERMAIIKIEDMEGEVESVIFPSTYLNVAEILDEGQVVMLIGRVGFRDDSPNIIASDIKKIDEVYKSIKSIKVDLTGFKESNFNDLRKKLSRFPGKTPVYLNLDTNSYKSVQIMVGEDLFVDPNEVLMNEIKEVVGGDRFSVTI